MELFLCYFFVKWKLPVIVCSLESLLLKNLWKFRIRHRHLNLLYRRIFWVVRAFSTTLMTLSFIYVFKVGGTRDYFSVRRTWSKKNYYGRERAWLVSNRHSPALPPTLYLNPDYVYIPGEEIRMATLTCTQILLAIGMLISGSINTLSKKAQNDCT